MSRKAVFFDAETETVVMNMNKSECAGQCHRSHHRALVDNGHAREKKCVLCHRKKSCVYVSWYRKPRSLLAGNDQWPAEPPFEKGREKETF